MGASGAGPSANLTAINEEYADIVRGAYAVGIPALVLVCLLAVLANVAVVVVAVGSTKHSRRSLTLKLTLSLALVDAVAALLIATGLVFNSYLHVVHALFHPAQTCKYSLVFEGLRLGSMVTSVLHILALTLNHYAAIAAPIKYQNASAEGGRLWAGLGVLWLAPSSLLCSLLLGLTAGEDCAGVLRVMLSSWLRLSLFLAIMVPLVLIVVSYVGIAVHVSRSQRRLSVHSAGRKESAGREESSALARRREREMRRRVRMVVTAALIMTTFLLGWLPSVVLYASTCGTCAWPALALRRTHPRLLVGLSITANLLIILKGLLNPIVYALRIPEIRRPVASLLRSGRLGQASRRGSEWASLPDHTHKTSLAPELSARTPFLRPPSQAPPQVPL